MNEEHSKISHVHNVIEEKKKKKGVARKDYVRKSDYDDI